MAKNAPQNRPDGNKLDSVLERLSSYYPRAIDPNLDRTFRLLGDLGNPHLKIPPAFHVAGTNGKGSTLAAIRAVLENAGLSCHVMTSPHLVRFSERIVIAGREIETDALISLLEEAETVNAGKPTTSFEIITAAGFLAFARAKADFTLLETGMGGRLDATNVLPHPLATAITVISHDHMQFLGTKLSDIAGEKAGIMKPGVPCVIAPQTIEAQQEGVPDIFRKKAADLGCLLYEYDRDWTVSAKPEGFLLHVKDGPVFDLPHPNLLGAHQIRNAATALITLYAARDHLPPGVFAEGNLAKGLRNIKWPGRLQRLTSGPLVDLLPEGWEIWCDGGHNDTGGEVLGEQASAWKQQDEKSLHLILGMLSTKDPRTFLTKLAQHAASTHTVTIPGHDGAGQTPCYSANDLAKIAAGIPSISLEQAVRNILGAGGKPGRILITGSLYLTGHALSNHY